MGSTTCQAVRYADGSARNCVLHAGAQKRSSDPGTRPCAVQWRDRHPRVTSMACSRGPGRSQARLERFLTPRRTEVVSLAVVFSGVLCGGLVDVHATHGIPGHQATDSTG